MGKRSDYKRKERDFYPTPLKAVEPLLPHLYSKGVDYSEPCAGDGALIKHLGEHGHTCVNAYDIEPQNTGILKRDALSLDASDFTGSDYIITNPPWDRPLMHAMIEHFRQIKPTWVLFDSNWINTTQNKVRTVHDGVDAVYLRQYCHKVVSIGRVKWIENSKNTGMEDASWYLFDKEKNRGFIELYGKV